MKINNHFSILLSFTMMAAISCQKPGPESITAQQEISKATNHLMLTERAIRLANISWQQVVKSGYRERISLPGKIINDPGQRSPVTSRIAGRVEKLYLKQPGTQIRSGEPVAEIYNQEWSSAVSLYIRLQQEPAAEALFTAARNKLKRFGFTDRQMEEWSNSGEVPRTFVVLAEKSGNISTIEVRQGSYIEAGQPLAWTEDTTSSAVIARLDPGVAFEPTPAMKVKVSGDGWESSGTVVQIDPVNEAGQAFRNIRVELSSKQSGLSAGATVRVHMSGPERKAILIPMTGLVFSGKQAGLFTTTGDGGFKLLPVTTGNQQNGLVEILDGLKGSETVVTSGTYLLYSELILKNNGNDQLLALLSAGEGNR